MYLLFQKFTVGESEFKPISQFKNVVKHFIYPLLFISSIVGLTYIVALISRRLKNDDVQAKVLSDYAARSVPRVCYSACVISEDPCTLSTDNIDIDYHLSLCGPYYMSDSMSGEHRWQISDGFMRAANMTIPDFFSVDKGSFFGPDLMLSWDDVWTWTGSYKIEDQPNVKKLLAECCAPRPDPEGLISPAVFASHIALMALTISTVIVMLVIISRLVLEYRKRAAALAAAGPTVIAIQTLGGDKANITVKAWESKDHLVETIKVAAKNELELSKEDVDAIHPTMTLDTAHSEEGKKINLSAFFKTATIATVTIVYKEENAPQDLDRQPMLP